jgi:hypothetical protein
MTNGESQANEWAEQLKTDADEWGGAPIDTPGANGKARKQKSLKIDAPEAPIKNAKGDPGFGA